MRFTCPHCGTAAVIRSSKQITPILWEHYCQCKNVECGFTFCGAFHIERELSPSSRPNPAIVLPGRLKARHAPAPDKTVLSRSGVPFAHVSLSEPAAIELPSS